MSSTLVIAIVTIAGTFGFMYIQRKRLATQHAHLRAGQLAPQLGMQLVEGDPEFNLAIQSVQPSVQNIGSAGGFVKQMAKTQFGGTLGEFKLRMLGQPYGVPAELVLYCKQDYQPGMIENVTTTWFDLRLSVQTSMRLPPFDLRLRKETTGLEAREGEPLPLTTFGDPLLDQRYIIAASDPAVPRRIATALGALAPHLLYVHIVGDGARISFVMTPTSVMCSAMSFAPILHALVSIAAALEGRPLPAAAA